MPSGSGERVLRPGAVVAPGRYAGTGAAPTIGGRRSGRDRGDPVAPDPWRSPMTAPQHAARPEAADDDPTLRTVMSPHVVCIVPDASLRIALQLMVTRNVRHLPVVEGIDHARVVTEVELLRGIVAARGPLGIAPLRVHDVARTAVVLRPDDRLSAAARAMHDTGCDAVLVEDRTELVGIVTATDVISAVLGRR